MKDNRPLSSEWQTPQWLYEELNKEFNFDIDLCATEENSKCMYWSDDYLNDEMCGSFNGAKLSDIKNQTWFMNPPYSNPKPFIEKAWKDSKHCKIVCLVPVCTTASWWAIFWNYEKDKTGFPYNSQDLNRFEIGPKKGCEVRFFPKRIKFDPPQQLIDSGEVWKVNNQWRMKCNDCAGLGEQLNGSTLVCCSKCKGKGYRPLSGPTFSSALVIMDRR